MADQTSTEELQKQCNDILDDPNVLEEDKIDKVEDLIRSFHNGRDLSQAELERLVLDALWRHRGYEKQKPKEVNSTLIPKKPLSGGWIDTTDTPPPPDETKINRKQVSKSKKKQKGISLDEWNQKETSAEKTQEYSPFDMLRQVLGDQSTNDDIQHALEKNNFDIQRTLELLMKGKTQSHRERVLQSETQVCKYFAQFGECLRADCMYSHDLSFRICRFWLQGECLSGDTCQFVHEIPPEVFDMLVIDSETAAAEEKPISISEQEFPELGAGTTFVSSQAKVPVQVPAPKLESKQDAKKFEFRPSANKFEFKPGAKSFTPSFAKPDANSGKPLADTPTKGAAASPVTLKMPLNRSVIEIGRPKLIPWETQDYGVHAEYISHRMSALRHGEMRNKYLQMATGSWHKNDAAIAKQLSKKGQFHNDKMAEAYAAASDLLYAQRSNPGSEIFIDLHGIYIDDSLDLLEEVLQETEEAERSHPRPVYAICGRGHHILIKNDEDKLTKAVKKTLDDLGYEWKEFYTPETKFGKVIGIDPWSHV